MLRALMRDCITNCPRGWMLECLEQSKDLNYIFLRINLYQTKIYLNYRYNTAWAKNFIQEQNGSQGS